MRENRLQLVLVLAALAVGCVVRIAILPAQGFRDDTDQFAAWVHAIATNPLGQAYRENLSFPPVMVYIWAGLAALEPAFRTVGDASDQAIRALMKTPAVLADLGIVAGVAFGLRDRPRWALASALAMAISPAVVYLSAWWGQYESIYVLAGLVALLCAWSARPNLAGVFMAVAVMTKPQALVFVPPFAAWLLARFGLRRTLLAGAVGSAVIVAMWLPFVADDGPGHYLRNLAAYQNGTFALLSLRAWNFWGLVQELIAGSGFVSDTSPVLGPVTFRWLGFMITALVEAAVVLAVLRSPSRRNLALGMAASVLVTFAFLTTMHERYAYGALVFLGLLLPDRRVVAVWLVLSVTFTLNLFAVAAPDPGVAALLSPGGPSWTAGPIVMLGVTAACVLLLFERAAAPRTPPDTSAGSAAARPAA